jgi:hypothetical protein
MAAEDFFNRWAKRNAEAVSAQSEPIATATPTVTAIPVENKAAALPTLEDVARLTKDSNFKPFLAKGVDEAVKRSAMKKLFSDPHFNLMDGLDTYIDDYNKFEPIPPEMLAMLNHAKALLDPLAQFKKPLLELIEPQAASVPDCETAQADIAAPAPALAEPEDCTMPTAPEKQADPKEPARVVEPTLTGHAIDSVQGHQ